jgi:hypothetical protein
MQNDQTKHQTIERKYQILLESRLYSANWKKSWSRYSFQIFHGKKPNVGLFYQLYPIFRNKLIWNKLNTVKTVKSIKI